MTRSKPFYKRVLGPAYRFVKRAIPIPHPRRFVATGRWVWHMGAEIRRRRRDPRTTVAVDVSMLWEPPTGIGWYLIRLLSELATQKDLALRLYGPSLAEGEDIPPPAVTLPQSPAIELVRYPMPEEAVVHPEHLMRLVRRLERWLVAADGNQVVFAPNFYPERRFELALRSGNARLVVTVHDLAFRRFPWTVGEETGNLIWRHLDQVLWKAAWIVTPSETVREELELDGMVLPERVRAIRHGPGQISATGRSSRPSWAPDCFGLFVGTLEPRKNLDTLLEAWQLLRRQLDDSPSLVVCGRFGWKNEHLRRKLEAARAEGWLHYPGYVSNTELAALLREAAVLAFPSLYEGFGLPVLEALTAGTPVVASDLPVLRELAGDAALYAPPRDVTAWAEQFTRVLTVPGLRQQLSISGRRRAQAYSWDRSAEMHMAVFRAAAPGAALA